MAAQLLALLVDPEDRGELIYVEAEGVLYNPRLRRSYPIVDDIPVMLVTDASKVSDSDHARFTAAR